MGERAPVRAGTLLAAALALFLAGCSVGPSPAPAGRSMTQVASDIHAAKLTDARSLHQLDRDRGTPNSVAAARQVLASTPTGDQAWAAVYLYADAGTDPAPLKPYLAASAPLEVRALAAAGAVSMGDASGFPVLIELLGHDDPMAGTEPLEPAWKFAALALVRATGDASMGPSLEAPFVEASGAQQRWQTWWSTRQANLRWNANQHVWSTS